MDGFSGYNQIKMHKDDIPKDLIGKTMEVYVDDMLVKSLVKTDHITHLREAFEVLRHHKMMLNPTKCAFGVGSGKFLGLMVSKRGIEANPDKIKAILDMEPPKTIKGVQKLTGRVAALGRFISKSDYARREKNIVNKSLNICESLTSQWYTLIEYLKTEAPLQKPAELEKIPLTIPNVITEDLNSDLSCFPKFSLLGTSAVSGQALDILNMADCRAEAAVDKRKYILIVSTGVLGIAKFDKFDLNLPPVNTNTAERTENRNLEDFEVIEISSDDDV
ncbi:hypothetical protein AgCh_039589 [Apium graveolens]